MYAHGPLACFRSAPSRLEPIKFDPNRVGWQVFSAGGLPRVWIPPRGPRPEAVVLGPLRCTPGTSATHRHAAFLSNGIKTLRCFPAMALASPSPAVRVRTETPVAGSQLQGLRSGRHRDIQHAQNAVADDLASAHRRRCFQRGGWYLLHMVGWPAKRLFGPMRPAGPMWAVSCHL
jgi:hypothetical protein